MVIDYGAAVNPHEPDPPEALKTADCTPLETIQELRGIAYSVIGEPEKVRFADRAVNIIEVYDGIIMDTVRQLKLFGFAE